VATDDLMVQSQFQALSQLGATAGQASQVRGAAQQGLAQILSIGTNIDLNILTAEGGLARRRLDALISKPSDAGARLRAESQAGLGSSLSQVGAGLLKNTGLAKKKTGDFLTGPAAEAELGRIGQEQPISMQTSGFGKLGSADQPIQVGGRLTPRRQQPLF